MEIFKSYSDIQNQKFWIWTKHFCKMIEIRSPIFNKQTRASFYLKLPDGLFVNWNLI